MKDELYDLIKADVCDEDGLVQEPTQVIDQWIQKSMTLRQFITEVDELLFLSSVGKITYENIEHF